MQLQINLLLLHRVDCIIFETIPILDTTHKQESSGQIEVIVEQILMVKKENPHLEGNIPVDDISQKGNFPVETSGLES